MTGRRLRAVPPGFDPARLGEIDGGLEAIEAEHGVRILLAIENGSRAWGFSSPDSDYDCRFLYVRGLHDYLSPWRKRDVIELPLEGKLDLAGWELGKALSLLLKGNAVVVEWLTSPNRLPRRCGSARLAPRPRAGLCEPRRDRPPLSPSRREAAAYLFPDGKPVRLKKIFYALRPAAARRWLRLHPAETIAPMHFPTLMARCDAPPDVVAIVDALVRRKAETRELGEAPLPPAIVDFVDSEFALTRAGLPARAARLDPAGRAAAEKLFREALAAPAGAASALLLS